jgi:predicted PhzF superfamily epimerase YddE/YHI9
VAQGAEMGRPSELGLLVVTSGGVVRRTSVYGSVSRVARGELVALP